MSIVADKDPIVNSPKKVIDNEKIAEWALHKAQSRTMAKRLYAAGLKARAARMYSCGDYIVSRVADTGEVVTDTAQLCRDRLCSICSWRLSLRRFAEMMAVINAIEPQIIEYGYKVTMLTLTVRNVPINDLRACLDTFARAWHNMSRREMFRGVVGWSRNLEITYNKQEKTYHPHYHCLLIWKKEDYTEQAGAILRDGWKHAYKCDYDPIIDIREAYSKENDDRRHAVVRSALEAFKYSVKPSTLQDIPQEDLYQFAAAVSGFRFVGYGKVIKEVRHALAFRDADEPVSAVEDAPSFSDEMTIAVMRWNGTAYTETTLTDEPWLVSARVLEREIELSRADKKEVGADV